MKIYDGTGGQILDVEVDDSSYRYRAIMGEHSLTLKFSLPEHVELPVGAYVEYQGERFTLERPGNLKMHHTRHFEYAVTFDAPECKAKTWKFRNPADGRLKFPLTAKPHEHLKMFVDNMNAREGGWTAGDCVEGTETLIAYDHDYCIDALKRMAETFNTEYEFDGRRVSLRKVERNKDNPLPLSYGRGNGFKSGVGRSDSDETPVEILYVQGGSRNIDPSKYHNPSGAPQTELLLPRGQRLEYGGRTYEASDDGLSIRRADKPLSSKSEDSLDCTEIYPKRVGEISSVVAVDEANNFYDMVDDSIPASLDYGDCLIGGETMTVIFQSGMLAGREFDVKYVHEAKDGKKARRFEIVPAEMDGMTMPGGAFIPKVGDTYAVFHCMLPDSYIRDDATKAGASWDMFRKAAEYLHEHEDRHFIFTGELDGIWAKRNWTNVGGRLVPGGHVLFTDSRFAPDGVAIRITGIKDYVNRPHSPEIELSNATAGTGLSSALKRLEAEEAVTDDRFRQAEQFTKRRWRDARETMGMLDAAWQEDFSHFSASVSPLAVQTMMMLVGDESLQFRFVDGKTRPREVAHTFAYDKGTKQLKTGAGIIQHLTLGIDTLCPEHDASEYKFWDMAAYTSAALDVPEKKYYLYAKCPKTAGTGEFILSETAVAMEGVEGYYHLLAGILNSEHGGERSFVTLYGFTEILPGRITTDRIVSTDGETFFDLVQGIISGRITFQAGSSGLYNLSEWNEVDRSIKDARKAADEAAQAVKDLKTDVDTAFRDGIITEAERRMLENDINIVETTKAKVDATYEGLHGNGLLTGDAKTGLEAAKAAFDKAVEALIASIEKAIADDKATEDESADVDAKYDAFNKAYAAFEKAVEAANKAVQGKLKEEADAAKKAADEAAQAVKDLKTDVDTAFRDGIITEAERRMLENDINIVETTKAKVDATYEGLHGNSFLTGDAKTGLETAKAAFDKAVEALTASIKEAIADDKATEDESADVDAKYDAFNKAYAAFEKAVEAANKAIQGKLKEEAERYTDSSRNQFAKDLGYEDFADLEQKAKEGKTLIDGGLIRTSLIDVENLIAGHVLTWDLIAQNIKTKTLAAEDLTVTGKSKIGNFSISGGWLTCDADSKGDGYIDMRGSDTRIAFGHDLIPAEAGGAYNETALIENKKKNVCGVDSWKWTPHGNKGIALAVTSRNSDFPIALQGDGYNRLQGGLNVLTFMPKLSSDIATSSSNAEFWSLLPYQDVFVIQEDKDTYYDLPTLTQLYGYYGADGNDGWFSNGLSIGFQAVIRFTCILTRYSQNVRFRGVKDGSTVIPIINHEGEIHNVGNYEYGCHDARPGEVVTFYFYNKNYYLTSNKEF